MAAVVKMCLIVLTFITLICYLGHGVECHNHNLSALLEGDDKCMGKFNTGSHHVFINNALDKCLTKSGLKETDLPNTVKQLQNFDDKCFFKCLSEEYGWVTKEGKRQVLDWNGIQVDAEKFATTEMTKETMLGAAKPCFDTYQSGVGKIGEAITESSTCKLMKEFMLCYSESVVKLC